MKSTNVPVYGDRPRATCGWCGRGTWGFPGESCLNCRGIEANLRNTPTETHALRGGRWVSRGAIKVWDGPRDADDPQIEQRRTTGPKPRAECGSEAAHRRHRRHGERPCDACRAAAKSARQDRLARAKGDAA